MNTQTIHKTIVASATIASLALITSCATINPEYAAFKKQQAANAATTSATTTNPYGVPGAVTSPSATSSTTTNPYSVPGANGETGAPYQPIPGVSTTPSPSVVQNIPTPQPYTPLPADPSATASTHTVAKGDTIWGLTRKYGVTSDQLREANNLTTDTIWVGQKLAIPVK